MNWEDIIKEKPKTIADVLGGSPFGPNPKDAKEIKVECNAKCKNNRNGNEFLGFCQLPRIVIDRNNNCASFEEAQKEEANYSNLESLFGPK